MNVTKREKDTQKNLTSWLEWVTLFTWVKRKKKKEKSHA